MGLSLLLFSCLTALRGTGCSAGSFNLLRRKLRLQEKNSGDGPQNSPHPDDRRVERQANRRPRQTQLYAFGSLGYRSTGESFSFIASLVAWIQKRIEQNEKIMTV